MKEKRIGWLEKNESNKGKYEKKKLQNGRHNEMYKRKKERKKERKISEKR